MPGSSVPGDKKEQKVMDGTVLGNDAAFFEGVFETCTLEQEKEILNAFDAGYQASQDQSMTPHEADFRACDSASVVDELMSIAGGVNVPEDDPLLSPFTTPFPTSHEPRECATELSPIASGAVSEHNFPRKLYRLLEDCETNAHVQSIVSWSEDGTYFKVLWKQKFVEDILPNYFDQSQYASFRRQLNMYNFVRKGNTSAYSHPFFLKGRPDLLDQIARKKVNTNNNKSDQ